MASYPQIDGSKHRDAGSINLAATSETGTHTKSIARANRRALVAVGLLFMLMGGSAVLAQKLLPGTAEPADYLQSRKSRRRRIPPRRASSRRRSCDGKIIRGRLRK